MNHIKLDYHYTNHLENLNSIQRISLSFTSIFIVSQLSITFLIGRIDVGIYNYNKYCQQNSVSYTCI